MNAIPIRMRSIARQDGPDPSRRRPSRRGVSRWMVGLLALVLPVLPAAAQAKRSPEDLLLVLDASGSMQLRDLALGGDSSLGEELMLGLLDLASLDPATRLAIAGIGGWNDGPGSEWIWRGPPEGIPRDPTARREVLEKARAAIEAFRGTSQASDPNVFTERILAPFREQAKNAGHGVRVVLLTDGVTEINQKSLREGVYEGTWAAEWSESAEQRAIQSLEALQGEDVHVSVFQIDPSGGSTPPSAFLDTLAKLNHEGGTTHRLGKGAGIQDLFVDLWLEEPWLGLPDSPCESILDHGWVDVAGDVVDGAFPVVGPSLGARLLLWGPGCGGALTLRRGSGEKAEEIPAATWEGGKGPYHRVLFLDGLARGNYFFTLRPEGAPIGSRIEWLCLQRLHVEPFFALESPHEGPWRPGDEGNLAAGWTGIGAKDFSPEDTSLRPDLEAKGSLELLAKEPKPGYRHFRIDSDAAAGEFLVKAQFRLLDEIPGTQRLRCCYPKEKEIRFPVKPLARLAARQGEASAEGPIERRPYPIAVRLVTGTLPPDTTTRLDLSVRHPLGGTDTIEVESTGPKELRGTWKPSGSGDFTIPSQSFPQFDLEEARFSVTPIPWWERWLWPLLGAFAVLLAVVLWLASVRRFRDQHLRLLDEAGAETDTVHFLRQLPGRGLAGAIAGPPELDGPAVFQVRHRPFPARTRLRGLDSSLRITIDEEEPAGKWALLSSGCVVGLEKGDVTARYRFYEVPASVDEDLVILDLDA